MRLKNNYDIISKSLRSFIAVAVAIIIITLPVIASAKDDFKKVEVTPKKGGEVFDGHGPFGLGIMLGEPSGVTAKLWLSEGNSLQVGGTWSLNHEYIAIIADYTYSFWYLINSAKTVMFPLYIGFGGVVGVGGKDSVNLSARVPLGVAVAFKNAPVEIFIEIAPALVVITEVKADIMGAIGARYYF